MSGERPAETVARIAKHIRDSGAKLWISTPRGFTEVDPSTVSRLLCLRLHDPYFGVRRLLDGEVFHPTPESTVRLATGTAAPRTTSPTQRRATKPNRTIGVYRVESRRG